MCSRSQCFPDGLQLRPHPALLRFMPRAKEVDTWMARYESPMKPVVQRIREILLAADPRIGECIKWQAPTFTYQGNLASFYPKSKQHASLMFHQGAKIPGRFPRLEGSGGTSRVMKIGSVKDAYAAKKELEAIAKAWCAFRDGGSTKKKTATKKKAAKKKAPKKKAAKRRR